MAKRKVNKSQLIREYHASNPTANHSDIARAITEMGFNASPALVNQALKGSTKAKTKVARKLPVAKASVSNDHGTVNVDQIILAADFCRACGGIENAIAALNAVKKIADKMR
jgi:hypothetical protein